MKDKTTFIVFCVLSVIGVIAALAVPTLIIEREYMRAFCMAFAGCVNGYTIHLLVQWNMTHDDSITKSNDPVM